MKPTLILVDSVVTALLLLVGVINLSSGEVGWGVAITVAAALYFTMAWYRTRALKESEATDAAYVGPTPLDFNKKAVEPEATDAENGARYRSLIRDQEVAKQNAANLLGKSVEPLPTPGDEFGEDIDAWAVEDVVGLEALWKNAKHRKEYPNCRYCLYMDKRKAADKAVIDDAEPGTRGAL